jgi:hypothetical protein
MGQALEVCGQVQQPGAFDFKALAQLSGQIEEISALVPGRSGGGVRLASLLAAVRPRPEATHLTVESSDGSFSASYHCRRWSVREWCCIGSARGHCPRSRGARSAF